MGPVHEKSTSARAMPQNPLNLIVIVTLFLCFSAPGLATEQDSTRQRDSTQKPQSARELVQSLSSPDEDTRIKSEKALLEIGLSAKQDLEDGSRSVNIEISSRCQRILGRIVEKDQKQKRAAFLANTGDSNIPTWESFTSRFENDSKEARQLFLNVCKTHSDHFENWHLKGIDDDSAEGAVRLARKASTMLNPDIYRDINIIVGFFFVDSIAQERLNKFKSAPEVIAFEKQRHLNSLKSLNYLTANKRMGVGVSREYRKAFEKLTARWFRALETSDSPSAAQSKMRLIYQSFNELLIDQLADRYKSLRNDQKLQFLDIVRHYSRSEKLLRVKIDPTKVFRWLRLALEDQSTLLTTRLCDKPSAEIKVTPKQLALAITWPLVAKSDPDTQKSLQRAFGSMPLSLSSINVLQDEAIQAEVMEKVTNAVNPDGS